MTIVTEDKSTLSSCEIEKIRIKRKKVTNMRDKHIGNLIIVPLYCTVILYR